jgi:membrane protease YdiL (CAAX protease family)
MKSMSRDPDANTRNPSYFGAGPDRSLSKGRIAGEILLVLGVSLGMSSIYAIVNLVDLSTRKTSLGSQSVALNSSLSNRQVFDFVYQFLGIVFDLVPVALVIYILWQVARPHLGRLGVDFRHPGRDLLWGIVLALIIGAGGIGIYLGARALGLAVSISADSLPSYWWAVPILLFSALRSALQE